VVWLCHRKVLRAGGFSFFSWRREVLKEFYRSVRMIKGVDAIEIRKETKQDLKLRA
jgi:hypothetical protein